ncbi:MAG: hypothetical protein FWG70_08975 [Oscillospiraceae bacterium]|nr:hypothetical protein [Oscillospiraceae bacterium]
MRKYLCFALIMVTIPFLTSCSEDYVVNPESAEMRNRESADITSAVEISTPTQPEIRITFDSLEEWWEYEFDSPTRNLDSEGFGVTSQHKKFILPLLPEEYGEYTMVSDGSGIYFYCVEESAPKIKELKEQYGKNAYIYVLISQLDVSPRITGWSLDDYVKKARESYKKSTFASTEKDGMRFEYNYWSGLNIFDEPSSFSYIMAFYEDKYYVSVSLPFGDEKSILNFIDELRFETYTVGDVSMIETVAEEARTARVEESDVIEFGEARREE